MTRVGYQANLLPLSKFETRILTAFEYITIPVSIVLALGIGKLLAGVFAMFEHDKRDWIFIAWCSAVLMLLLGQWLAIWQLNVNASWSPLEFVVVMLSPVIYYAAAHILVSGQPESVSSWSSRLARVARPLIWIMIAAAINSFFRTYYILGVFPLSFVFLIAAVIAVNLAAIFWPTRWLLAIAAIVWLIPPGLLFTMTPDL